MSSTIVVNGILNVRADGTIEFSGDGATFSGTYSPKFPSSVATQGTFTITGPNGKYSFIGVVGRDSVNLNITSAVGNGYLIGSPIPSILETQINGEVTVTRG